MSSPDDNGLLFAGKWSLRVCAKADWPSKKAAVRLGSSYRHCRRAYKRFREEGDVGLVRRHRGQPSNRAKPQAFEEAVLFRYQERYEGFGPVLAMEKLAEEGYVVGRETLRIWMIGENLWQPRRKRARHRKRRERKDGSERFSMLDFDRTQKV